MIGQTNRGNFEVKHEENLTIVELCYFKDDEPHFAIPSVFNDEIEINFIKSGLRKVEFRIKNTVSVNEKNCETCSEYYSDTILLNVLPKNQYTFSPSLTDRFISVETETNDDFSDKVINLYSISGQFVKKIIVNSDNNLIDLNDLSAGIYVLESGQNECDRKIFRIVKIE